MFEISIKLIAEMTGLSTATVSHVLNDSRKVSDKNKEKVLNAAKKIGYRPNIAAKMLKTQKSNTIAFVFPTNEDNKNANFFYMEVLQGILKKLSETDYDIILSNFDASESSENSLNAVRVCKKQWVDGIIFVPSSTDTKQLNVLREMEVPFVLLDRRIEGDTEFSCVDSNNRRGIFEAVELLAKSGKKRIGYIGGGLAVTSGQERFAGYKEAVEKLGLGYTDDYVRIIKHYSINEGRKSAKMLIEKGIDGLIISDNDLTMGAFSELASQNIKVPDQVGIIGFDDYDWMGLMSPPVTTVKQQEYHMGYLAADMIMRKLSGITINEKVMLDTSIVIRKSHGHTT